MRSEPLILDKDGNPKKIWPVQEGRKAWRLVLTLNMANRGKDFKTYAKAKAAQEALRPRYQDHEYTIVSRMVGYGPPYSKVSDEKLEDMNLRGFLWCAFCRKFRQFLWSPLWNIEKCPVCTISIRHFQIVRNNPRVARLRY
jgi:hypothetical protein